MLPRIRGWYLNGAFVPFFISTVNRLNQAALLALEDGSVFYGTAVGALGERVGEVVFNTAMSGYQEILTDPSYARQIVTLTYPHIGNTGVNVEDDESSNPFASGLVIRDLPLMYSSWRSSESLDEFLKKRGIVAIAEVDTRRLTRLLRDKGSLNGCIQSGRIDVDRALALAREFPGLKGMDLAKQVTTNEIYEWRSGTWCENGGFNSGSMNSPDALHVVAYDFGVKNNILRMLADRGCSLTVVPADYPAAEVMRLAPNGVFLSNGPGDPEPCDYAVEAISEIVERGLPTFGICLGHQLLGLASGASTVKMKFGHHGANHPVQDLDTGRVMISSQNHGFALDEATLTNRLRATYRSLFDGSLQGIERIDRPAFGFQGHPEASPGPHDVSVLFDRFIRLMRA